MRIASFELPLSLDTRISRTARDTVLVLCTLLPRAPSSIRSHCQWSYREGNIHPPLPSILPSDKRCPQTIKPHIPCKSLV